MDQIAHIEQVAAIVDAAESEHADLIVLPNPRSDQNPYVPVNGPAIGNLMSMFDFERNPDDG